ncbi:MAG: flagellar assembly protein FliX [Pseudomonadota bacterium]
MSIDLKALDFRVVGSSRRKTASKSSSGGLFCDLLDEKEEVASASSSCNLNPFLALQEFSSSYDQDIQKMKEIGASLLSHLNDVRFDLINGDVDKDHLINLQNALDKNSVELQFPELQEVINSIRIRAGVELAKLEKNN